MYLIDRVATEEFTVKMLGRDRTFPAGTVILIPISLSMFDKNVWGDNAYAFDLNRPCLIEKSMMFHSVGERHAGRMCPGKYFTLNMVTDIIIKCGKARRELAGTK